MKKLKAETPKLNLENQLCTNTSIFKENLKIITNSIIDSIWKAKMETDNIQETIKSAFNQIYRRSFEEIKELEEEQYHSWVNSQSNTERLLSEHKNKPNSKKGRGNRNQIPTGSNDTGECDSELDGAELEERGTERTKSNEETKNSVRHDFALNDDTVFASSNERNDRITIQNIQNPYEYEKSDISDKELNSDCFGSERSGSFEKSQRRNNSKKKSKLSHFKEEKNSTIKLRSLTKKNAKILKSRNNSYRTPNIMKEAKNCAPFFKEYSYTKAQNSFSKKYRSPKIELSKLNAHTLSRQHLKDSILKRSFNRSNRNNKSESIHHDKSLRKENSCKVVEKPLKAGKRFNVDHIFRRV